MMNGGKKMALNFALLGCGRIAPRHAQALAELPGAKLVAVCDVVESRARQFAQKYGAEAYTDYRYILDRADVDVVNVCVPSGLHVPIAQDVARAGKHVLVEKPIALNLADADALIHTCDSAGVTLGVVLQNRFNPPMRDLRRVVDSGKLGRLVLGNATVRWYRPQEYYEDGWHGTWAMDGGALMNQSIHHIDALQWLMGEVKSVFAYTATLVHQMEAEDIGVAVVRFKNGALGTIEASTVTYPENLEGSVALFGESGSVKVGGTALNRKVFWKVADEIEREREMLMREQVDPPSVYGCSHREQIAEMIAAIREGRAPLTDGWAARKSLELVCAIYESARTHREVFLNPDLDLSYVANVSSLPAYMYAK
jgi:predicted dehydrogenase